MPVIRISTTGPFDMSLPTVFSNPLVFATFLLVIANPTLKICCANTVPANQGKFHFFGKVC